MRRILSSSLGHPPFIPVFGPRAGRFWWIAFRERKRPDSEPPWRPSPVRRVGSWWRLCDCGDASFSFSCRRNRWCRRRWTLCWRRYCGLENEAKVWWSKLFVFIIVISNIFCNTKFIYCYHIISIKFIIIHISWSLFQFWYKSSKHNYKLRLSRFKVAPNQKSFYSKKNYIFIL